MIIDQTDPPPLIDLADLKTRVDLIVVARALRLEGLKKSGSSYVARCPAHKDEGRPNLVLWPKVNGVKCYSCGWSADVIGLVAKVNGVNAGEAIRWLADLVGMQPEGKTTKKRGLGNKSKTDPDAAFPKGAPLPAPKTTTAQPAAATTPARPAIGQAAVTPKPQAVAVTEAQTITRPRRGLIIRWSPDAKPAVIGDFWRRLEDGRIEAEYTPEELYWVMTVAGRDIPDRDQYLAHLRSGAAGQLRDLTPEVMTAQPATPTPKPPSLRALVYEALLGHVKPPPSEGAIWLKDHKGVSFETQTAAGIGWLDWEAADKDLRATFGDAVLAGFGLMSLDKKTDQPVALAFKNHRLVFPFWIPTTAGGRAAVYLQARNINAAHEDRFRRPREATPSPYNVAAINAARAAGEEVFITEGESDCLTLTQLGKHAVGIVGSTGFKPDWAKLFDGLRVFVTQDADKAGEDFAKKVTQAFAAAGLEAPRVIKLPAGQDVTDFFTGAKSKKTAAAVEEEKQS